MKRFLSVLLLFCAFAASAQHTGATYVNSTGQVSSKPTAINGNLPANNKEKYYDNINFNYRSYRSAAEVLSYLQPQQRYQGLKVWVDSCGAFNSTSGVLTPGCPTEYVFDGGLQLRSYLPTEYDVLPHLLASGLGTQSNPFVSSDGTAGINTTFSNLIRGTTSLLIGARYSITSPILMQRAGITLRGMAWAGNQDPNGEAKGSDGTLLDLSTNGGIEQGVNTGRLFGQSIENMYIWGTGIQNDVGGAYNNTIRPGINVVTNGLDQARYTKIMLSNHSIGYACTSGNMDSPTFDDITVLNNGIGLFFRPGSTRSYYITIKNSVIADNDYAGIWMNSDQGDRGWIIQNCKFIRNSRKNTSNRFNCAVYLGPGGYQGSFINNDISETGRNSLNPGNSNTDANGLIIDGQKDDIISGNHIYSNTAGNGIVVRYSRNIKILNNNFLEADYSSTPGETKNLRDIFIDPNCFDIVVDQKGAFTITDFGVRTIINGLSTNSGDPDVTGQWFGITKPSELDIIDTLSGILYHYSSTYGRRIVATGLVYRNPNNSSGNATPTTVDMVFSATTNAAQTGSGTKEYAPTNTTTGYGHTLLSSQTLPAGQSGYIYAKYTNSTGMVGRNAALLFRTQNVNAGWQDASQGDVLGFTIEANGGGYFLKNNTSGPLGTLGQNYVPSGQTRYIRLYRDGATGSITVDISSTDPAAGPATWTQIYNGFGLSPTGTLYLLGDIEYNTSVDANGRLVQPKGVNIQ